MNDGGQLTLGVRRALTPSLAGVLLVVAIGLVASVARPAAPPSEAAPEGFEGVWEGFIAETPAKLSRVQIELKRSGETWEGAIDIPGAENLPLDAVRAAGSEVHFELQVGEALVVFDAESVTGGLSGQVTEGERSFPFDLRRVPVYPTPTDRVEAWRQDLDVVRSRFLEYDRSFEPAAKAAFEKALEELEASLPKQNDQQVIVALSAAVALSGNAHTRLYLLRNRTELRRLPLRTYWFTDGLYVVRATREHRDLLGCRVTQLASRDPRRIRESVGRLFAGNESWIDYKSPPFMTSPEILHGLGMIADMEAVPLQLRCRGDESIERTLKPLPLERKSDPTEPWRDLVPLRPAGESMAGGSWVSALAANGPAPLFVRNPNQRYWFEYLKEHKTLYFQYNRSQNMPEGASLAEVANTVEELVGRSPIERFILDLRFNTGGNGGIAAPFMKRLVALEKQGAIGRLFVVVGRATFSAGISHAAYLKQFSRATFVGEPIGDELDTWSEGGNIVLPNSRLTVHFTNGFHSLSNVERPELVPYMWTDLDLEELVPDIVVGVASEDYFAGRDPVLQTILVGDDS